MKSTGIVRRIDELGRVVIPKEIRKTLNINEGDPIEIYTNGDEIVLKKHSCFINIKDVVSKLVSAIDKDIIVCDNETVIVSSSKDLLNKSIGNKIKDIIKLNDTSIVKGNNSLEIGKNKDLTTNYVVSPIKVDNEIIGVVAIYSTSTLKDEDESLVKMISTFIENNLNN